MAYETVRLAAEGAVAVVTLHRPERLNALTAALFAELRNALDEVEANAAMRCLVITGAGRAFCAGQDLTAELPRGEEGALDLGQVVDRDYNPLVQRLVAFPLPTIAAVNGPAVGAGCNLALACDVVLAARSAYLRQAFARIGLMPDAGGTWFLVRALGPKRALALMLTAERVSAEEAERIGLVHRVFDDDCFDSQVRAFARSLAEGPTGAFRAMKRAVLAASGHSLEAQLALERDLQHALGRTRDFEEGLASFREKREPRFEGR